MEKEDKEPVNITFDGVDYEYLTLSEEARSQIVGIHYAEAEIKRFNMQIAMAQTARNAYVRALRAELPVIDNNELVDK